MNKSSGVIGYFAKSPVAANLLLLFIVVIGIFSWTDIKRQLFSTAVINKISIYAQLPGASPLDMEESVTIKIEESLKGLPALTRVWSRTGSGFSNFTIEIAPDESVEAVVNEVKMKIDAIATFPAKLEGPVIDKFHWNQSVMRLVLSGEALEPVDLKELGESMRNELLQLDNVQLVDFFTLPRYEIAIEIDPKIIRQYRVNLKQIATQIEEYSKNLSAGSIRTDGTELFIRLNGQSYRGVEFAKIPLIVGEQGQKVLLGEVSNINDAFVEQLRYSHFDGVPATSMQVYATEKQSMSLVADSLYQYIENKRGQLPQGVSLDVMDDSTRYLNQRIEMMLYNLLQGAILVFVVLALFLRFRVALWVMLGIPVVFLGAIMMMLQMGILINVTTLFAFIMVLGIVVDDAIVIGESAYSECEKNGHNVDNVITGVKKVATPVTFGVLTTMAVFMPLLFATGNDAGQFVDLSAVVLLCLLFSLIESKLILPAHLAHGRWRTLPEDHWRLKIDAKVKGFIRNRYLPLLKSCLANKTLTLTLFFGALGLSVSLLTSGWLSTTYLPRVGADTPKISVTMNDAVTDEQTKEIMTKLQQIVLKTNEDIKNETGQNAIENVLTYVSRRGAGEILVVLADESVRSADAFELSRRWYDVMSSIPGVYSISIQDEAIANSQGGAIGYRFYGKDIKQLNKAATMMMGSLSRISGVYNITSSVNANVSELTFDLKPVAYSLGLTPASVARQINAGFYGSEAQRITRDGRDIRVMVRYPEYFRSQRSALKYTRIYTPEGNEVLLGDVADIKENQGIKALTREKGFRSVLVLADVDSSVNNVGTVIDQITADILPKVLVDFPGVKTSLTGSVVEQQAQRNQMLSFSLIAILLVFMLLAIPLRSYVQPLIILSVVPFCLVGAAWGHYLLGYQFSLFSLFGIIAAIGVVVNDSLVLVHGVNELKAKGYAIYDAVIEVAQSRFRPILLTSVTTFVGLLPIMFESSLQGMYVAPMAISLAFALLFCTFTTLFFVPVIYVLPWRKKKVVSNESPGSAANLLTKGGEDKV